jgi:hypothetical protein
MEAPHSPGVLIQRFGWNSLYIMAFDNAADAKMNLLDKLTGMRMTWNLPAQPAAIALIGIRKKTMMPKYGF